MATYSSVLAWRIPMDRGAWQSFPGGSGGKESVCTVGDPGSIPRSGRSPGEGNGNPLQYSCLENSMDRGVWQTLRWPRVGHNRVTT